MTPRVGKVQIASSDPPCSIVCWLGQDRPDVVSGYGGWDEVTRPNRPPITTWKAPSALHLSLPILIDYFADGDAVSCEQDISTLIKMAGPNAADGATPRVRLTVTGAAVPYNNRTWIIGELSWGDAEMNGRGNRTRQACTVTLYEYVEDVYLTEKSAAKRRRQKAKVPKKKQGASAKRVQAKRKRTGVARPQPHSLSTLAVNTDTVGDGEDLLTIAARELGDADRWVEIAQLNGLRDPRSIKPGQVIRLP